MGKEGGRKILFGNQEKALNLQISPNPLITSPSWVPRSLGTNARG